jgi:hypothetical protein
MLIHWKKINCKKIICDYNFGGWGQEEGIVCVSPKIFLNKNFGLTNRLWKVSHVCFTIFVIVIMC